MRIAYFDTIAGVSGDMVLGAFISAGITAEELIQELSKLKIGKIELDISHVERSGISAIKLDIIVSTKQVPHRHLKDIVTMIDESYLNRNVKENSKKIFTEIAKAEAKVHNKSIDKVHFHEVGAVDSIIDVVGVAVCLDKLAIQSVYSSVIKVGSGGFVKAEHGKLPIPTPATMEILRGYPVVLTEIPHELTTPTGAAIIKAMSSGVLGSENIKVESIGYGAGSKEISQVPNLLRVMIGELVVTETIDEVVVIETNIDDMSPEIYPFVQEQLFLVGALDVYFVPIIMKKSRPGVLLTAIAHRTNLEKILTTFFLQTTTLGVRITPIERQILKRGQREVLSKLGSVKMKVVYHSDGEKLVPEYEECKRIAKENNLPIIEIYRILQKEFS